jgi:flap endonuclease-1
LVRFFILSLISKIVENVSKINNKRKKQFEIPENFNYKQARNLFKIPKISELTKDDISFKKPNKEEFLSFLVKENQFNEKHILTAINKTTKLTKTFID